MIVTAVTVTPAVATWVAWRLKSPKLDYHGFQAVLGMTSGQPSPVLSLSAAVTNHGATEARVVDCWFELHRSGRPSIAVIATQALPQKIGGSSREVFGGHAWVGEAHDWKSATAHVVYVRPRRWWESRAVDVEIWARDPYGLHPLPEGSWSNWQSAMEEQDSRYGLSNTPERLRVDQPRPFSQLEDVSRRQRRRLQGKRPARHRDLATMRVG